MGTRNGLNLNWDRYALQGPSWRRGPIDAAPDWHGIPPPEVTAHVATRRGCDLNPLDPVRDRLRLLSYLWPDQAKRLALPRAALGLTPAPVYRADAGDWLAGRALLYHGHCHLICHTIDWQYFPAATAARARIAIEAAGAAASAAAPLAWFGMEGDGRAPGAALTLRLWPGDLRLDLGRVDFHGRWVDWRAPPLALGQAHRQPFARETGGQTCAVDPGPAGAERRAGGGRRRAGPPGSARRATA